MDATVGDDECNCIVSRRSLCYNNDIVSPFSNESCRKVFVLCREGGHKTVAGHGRAGAVMSGGRLLTPKEQVEHLKAKGVTFNLCSEQEAERFLTEHSYLSKVSAYRKNYQKQPPGSPTAGRYIRLDFAYLIELSTIDMHLRYEIIALCLDVEHAIKVQLENDMIANPEEDGYRIVKWFTESESRFIEATERKMLHSYCREFYFHNADNLPVWVLFEVLSFGDLIKFYNFYYDVYHQTCRPPLHRSLLENVRCLRNACAHSNCLIADLHHREELNTSLSNYAIRFDWFSPNLRKKYLRKQFTQDFTALLIAHKELVHSSGMHAAAARRLRELFGKRMLRHRGYFVHNDVIAGAYSYCFELIRYYFC